MTDAETLARMAIVAIYEDAKRAAQPHIDRLMQLEAMKPPALPLISPDGTPQRWTLDHRTMDARVRPNHYRSPLTTAIERVTAQLEDAERHEGRTVMVNCNDLRTILQVKSDQ